MLRMPGMQDDICDAQFFHDFTSRALPKRVIVLDMAARLHQTVERIVLKEDDLVIAYDQAARRDMSDKILA